MKIYTYLLIDLGCIFIPFLASFYSKRAFYKEWKAFFIANTIVAIPFLIWDYIFTEAGIWGFNPDYLTGYYLGNLPIEEVLFFICIPYCCVFTYFALKYLLPKNPIKLFEKVITAALVIICILFMTIGFHGYYTFYTGLFTLLFFVYAYLKKLDLSYYFLGYCFIYPFFLASNGLLTGSFLEEPIVWYNDNENLGLRMGTIPVEDSVYGLLLIFLNILLFDKLTRYFKRNE